MVDVTAAGAAASRGQVGGPVDSDMVDAADMLSSLQAMGAAGSSGPLGPLPPGIGHGFGGLQPPFTPQVCILKPPALRSRVIRVACEPVWTVACPFSVQVRRGRAMWSL
jgi:hypothetical protein